MQSNLNEDQRRALVAMFMSDGWKMLRQELDKRAGLAVKKLVSAEDRTQDDINRGFIRCVDYILSVEKGLFAPIPFEEAPPPPPSDNRYE